MEIPRTTPQGLDMRHCCVFSVNPHLLKLIMQIPDDLDIVAMTPAPNGSIVLLLQDPKGKIVPPCIRTPGDHVVPWAITMQYGPGQRMIPEMSKVELDKTAYPPEEHRVLWQFEVPPHPAEEEIVSELGKKETLKEAELLLSSTNVELSGKEQKTSENIPEGG